MQTTTAPKRQRPSFFKSRAGVAGLLCLFALVVMCFSGLGDGFNQWSPWSPQAVNTIQTTGGTSQVVFYDTYEHAVIRFSMSLVACILFGVVGFFAARELSALFFDKQRRCFFAILFTMYVWHMLISLCYLVPSSFFNDYVQTQQGTTTPAYAIFDDETALTGALATNTTPEPSISSKIAAHDLNIDFDVGIWKVDDGRSFGTFLLISTAALGVILTLLCDFVLLRQKRLAIHTHAKYLIPLHLLLQFALFAASYTLIVRGWQTLLFITLIPIATDSFSFAIGRKFGRHSLIPHVSAKKTWGGAIGGILTATWTIFVFALLYAIPTFIHHPSANATDSSTKVPHSADPHNMITNVFVISFYNTGQTFQVYWWMGCIFIILISSIVATAGDLLFSAVKRRYKIKDFGTLLGKHGGVLDRVDSIVAVYVLYFVYLLVVYIVSGRSLLDMNVYTVNLTPSVPMSAS